MCGAATVRVCVLHNPVTKMKVTTEAERVLDLLADVAAAKGFEAESYPTIAKADVRGLPERFDRVWQQVKALSGSYAMKP